MKQRKLYISKSFFLLLAVLIYIDGYMFVFAGLIAVFLHELGHVAAIYLLGGKVSSLRLSVIGASMELDSKYLLTYEREALAALAGPAVSFFAAYASLGVSRYLFAGINFGLGFMNLLPAYPLDGGRILVCVTSLISIECAEKIKNLSSVIISGVVLGFGIAAWYWLDNIMLMCGAVWLVFSAIKQ